MKYTIGIDIGTSGTKAVLFNMLGQKIISKTVEYPLYQPYNGWAEQNPSDWKNAAFTAIRYITENSGVDVNSISAVGLTGQMHGLVMLDENGEVIRNAIIWCDQRTAEECTQIETLIPRKRLIEITANPALTGFTASKILWVKNHEPENYEKCRHILLPKDYIRYVLTGDFATDVSDASGMQLLDVPGRCWSCEVLDKLGINKNLLGKVYESDEITGCITEEASALTGLKAGTPVVAGASDNAAAAVGVGVVRNGTAFTTIGTSGVVFAHTDKPFIDAEGRIHTFCHAVKGKWHVMGVTQAAGLSLRWLRDTVCTEETEKAAELSTDPYVLMDKLASSVEVGADKLLYLPYLMGERTPHLDADARGAFIGLSAIHTKAHMIRAVMEGVGYSLKDCLGVLSDNGAFSTEMMLCGGGAKSKLWREMITDIFGTDSALTENDEGPAFGAAILAMVGTGIYESVEEACDRVVKLKERIAPVPNRSEKYLKYYNVYKNLYKSLKGDFKLLANIRED